MPNFTPEQANALLIDCIDANVRHAGYERTIELRTDYKTIVTGVGYSRFLSRYAMRETQEEFAQRLALTYQNLSATASPLLRKAGQISRVQDIKKGVNYSGTSERDQRDLQSVLDDFGGEGQSQRGSLDDYLTRHYDELSHVDPNAFILLDFQPFNAALGERARPYGVLFPCDSVYHFRYTRGVLDYLLVRVLVDYKDLEGVTKVATDLICYAGPFAIRYYMVAEGRQDLPELFDVFTAKNDTLYRVVQVAPGIDAVPAVRIGDMPDSETSGLTCVSRLFHAALDQFKELINLKSQNDIVTRKHGFPRRYERAPLCPGELVDTGYRAPCAEGKNSVTGQTCKECGGSGFVVHKSEQDTVRMKLDDNAIAEDMWDMSRLSYVEKPELTTIESFDTKIRTKQAEIYVAVYSSEQQVQINGPQTTKTATEYVVSREDQNNTLLPIADHKSICYKSLASYSARLMNISGEVEFLYEFPRDLKLSGLSELYADLKAARDANAPDFEIEQILDDIARKRYEADPTALAHYFIKKQHIPYYAFMLDKFEYFDTSNRLPASMVVLYANSDIIFGELEVEQPTFYDLAFAERDKLVSQKVAALEAKLPRPVSMNAVPVPTPQNPAPNPSAGSFAVGDQVMAIPGMEHMAEHAGLTMTVSEVQPGANGGTYALKLPDGTIHKWYQGNELMSMTKPM